MEAFWFWIMKPVAELAIGLAALIVAAAGYGLICLPGWWKQRKCPHSRVRETGACDAICQSCGKNLGFIGAWRDKQKDKPSNAELTGARRASELNAVLCGNGSEVGAGDTAKGAK